LIWAMSEGVVVELNLLLLCSFLRIVEIPVASVPEQLVEKVVQTNIEVAN
jgi:hypothetical protein